AGGVSWRGQYGCVDAHAGSRGGDGDAPGAGRDWRWPGHVYGSQPPAPRSGPGAVSAARAAPGRTGVLAGTLGRGYGATGRVSLPAAQPEYHARSATDPAGTAQPACLARAEPGARAPGAGGGPCRPCGKVT